MLNLDDLDTTLIRLLHEHPRAGHLELSRLAGIARATVTSRLRRMEQAGVITGYGPDLDLEAAGYAVQAFVTLQISQGRLADVQRGLEQIAGVIEAFATTGSSDVVARVVATSHRDLQQTLLLIDTTNGISRSESIVVLSEVIARRLPPLT
ncbi:winged helix-turn-helix transcriptional regulator [Epidermidibacterium keratini]|uniref:Winged helix-turn-helix transcriptional regulator n=1 Tax=Epidermidibacterium keratini TaxID=1891644 RepID=A0A7L4YIK9_9ACTN|nr:Lrp/AsnC family transcriptional regulator [Epidermidibacterium keratini]QHB99175.1 winged helix-turn-helix transcriptional regulator [Epidermidibacterium keratini]